MLEVATEYCAGAKPRSIRWSSVAVGALGSIVIHALLFEAVWLGTASRKAHAPRDEGIGASAIASEEAPVGTLIFMTDSSVIQPEEESFEELASKGAMPRNPLVTIASPDEALAATLREPNLGEDEESPTEQATGDPLGRAVLFGRYMNQIQARIERAWIRPRTPLNEALFECRVQILQSREGEVLEVTLQDCNRNIHWQESLVQAIQRASPLPAPPDPRVFAEALLMAFNAAPFGAQSAPEGYELEPAALAATRPSRFEE